MLPLPQQLRAGALHVNDAPFADAVRP